MGCAQSAAAEEPKNNASSSKFPEDGWKPVHSAVRWKKPIEEIEKLLAAHPEASNCKDPVNGNRPIHIAAQNDHLDILKLLVRYECDLNAKNGKGNTGVHMAIGYNYYHCAKVLTDAGADPLLLNDAGFPGNRGLEGDKTTGIAALASATTASEVNTAFEFCESEIEDLKKVKSNFVQAGMAASKSLKESNLWTSEMQSRFKAITQSL